MTLHQTEQRYKTERDIGEHSHGNNTLSGTDGETVHYITLELSGSGRVPLIEWSKQFMYSNFGNKFVEIPESCISNN